jgi:hypothetical protein
MRLSEIEYNKSSRGNSIREQYFLEKYANKIDASESWVIRFAVEFAQSNAAKKYCTKEARELIEGLVKSLKQTDDCDSAYEMITKAENFLKNNK